MILGKPKADEWTMLFTPRCIHCGTHGYVRVRKQDYKIWKYTSRHLRPLVQDLFPYIHKDYRGKKLAYDAYTILFSFLKEQYNLKCFYLEVLDSNIRALNLYKKLGFIHGNYNNSKEECY